MLSQKRTFRALAILLAIALIESLLAAIPFLMYAAMPRAFEFVEPRAIEPVEPVQMAVTAYGSFAIDKEFTVEVFVKNCNQGQRVVLRLPDGVELVNKNESLEAELPTAVNGDYVSAFWKVRGTKPGTRIIEAEVRLAEKTIASAEYDVRIRSRESRCTFGLE